MGKKGGASLPCGLIRPQRRSGKVYPTDLTDSAWQVIDQILADKRKRKYYLRAILNALL